MRRTKQLLALLLALALALGLALPAMADDDEPVFDPTMMPVITQQPMNLRLKASYGGSYQVGIQAHIPNGDQVHYRLYYGDQLVKETSTPSVSCNNESGEYHIVAYNRANPEYYVTSKPFHLVVYA